MSADVAYADRVAVADDVAALSEIGLASFRAAYEGSCSAEEFAGHLAENFSVAVIGEELRVPGRTYLLATVNGVPAAFVKLREGEPPHAIPARNALEIQQFYVSPSHQRLGLGRRLMHAALAATRQKSFHGAWLSVWEDASWAVPFYLGCGFEQVGNADFILGSTVFNDYLMWRRVFESNEE